jgi:Tol biopolymer transport system component
MPGPFLFYLWRVAADGSRPPERLEAAGMGTEPAILGHRLAFTRVTADQDLVRLTRGAAPEVFPASSSFFDGSSAFSPDGRRVAFESMRSGERMEIWLAGADGHDPVQLTQGPGLWQGSPAWSPDGRRVAFDSQRNDGTFDIWTLDVASGGPERLTLRPGNENVPSWSRDGGFVYYSAAPDGRHGIWRIPARGGMEQLVATLETGPGRAQESPDGRTLFFAAGPGPSPLFALPLAGGPTRQVLERVCWNAFEVTAGAIYYGDCGRGPDVPLHRLDLASGRDSVVATLERYRSRVTVSPDGRTILYASETTSGSNLLLVEGFR